MPEPDVAVVPGHEADYEKAHPRTALLLVEVAEWSLPQDRVTKRAIYAAAGVPEYWIVNLRDGWVEVLRAPDRRARPRPSRSSPASRPPRATTWRAGSARSTPRGSSRQSQGWTPARRIFFG